MNIKIALIELGKKQVDLLPGLKERGFKVSACDISKAINETQDQPKMQKLRDAVVEIIEDWKKAV